MSKGRRGVFFNLAEKISPTHKLSQGYWHSVTLSLCLQQTTKSLSYRHQILPYIHNIISYSSNDENVAHYINQIKSEAQLFKLYKRKRLSIKERKIVPKKFGKKAGNCKSNWWWWSKGVDGWVGEHFKVNEFVYFTRCSLQCQSWFYSDPNQYNKIMANCLIFACMFDNSLWKIYVYPTISLMSNIRIYVQQ